MIAFHFAQLPAWMKVSACVGVLLGSLHAQDAGTAKAKVPPRVRVSLIAIGDPPNPGFSIKDGKRHLTEVSEAEYPPSLLYVRDAKEKKGFKEVALGLNAPSDPIAHPNASEMELLERKADSPDQPPSSYLRVPLPDIADDLSVFLVRDPKTKSWRNKPLLRVFQNGSKTFPLSSVRVMNFSNYPLRYEVVGQVFDLAAQQVKIISLPHATQGILTYKVGAQVSGQMVMLATSATTYTADARVNLIAYSADGADKRQPVKLMTYYELPFKEATPEVSAPAEVPPSGAPPATTANP